MRFLRASLLALFLGSSSVSAASFYFGVRLDGSTVFEQANQTTITTVIPMIGVHAGIDFESPSSGFGLRATLSSQIVSGVRASFDGYVRSPIPGLPELGSYLGVGSGIVIEPRTVFFVGIHLLAGLEYQLSPGIGIFAELSPGTALGFGKNSCVGAPLPSEPPTSPPPCYPLVPFTLEAALGLNFRF